jgi:hypothetical protein
MPQAGIIYEGGDWSLRQNLRELSTSYTRQAQAGAFLPTSTDWTRSGFSQGLKELTQEF